MAGDDEGFEEFVGARYMDLLRIAYLLTGSAHEAEDLLQSALVKVMRRWKRIEDPVSYLRRVMVNQHISWWRRYKSHEIVTDEPPERQVSDPADRIASRAQLSGVLRALSPRMRAVVVLRYLADLPETEVAAILGCSVGTVKSQASRGLARLREVIEPERTLEYVDR
jgi:RNA polymerase sigma-70 factor (sigma-E family)